ncbi:MAG TPA: hypothetical protein VNH15_00115 [Elusimicrobiota bacterium]|nr:hypothetical protein [Elusimicrobiota bacterium]
MPQKTRRRVFWVILGGICALSLIFFALGFLRYRAVLAIKSNSATAFGGQLTPYSSKLGPVLYFPGDWSINRDDSGALVAKNGTGAVFSIYPAGSHADAKAVQTLFPLISGILENIFARNCSGDLPRTDLQETRLPSGPVYYYSASCAGKDGSSIAILTMAWLDGANAYTGGTFFKNQSADIRPLTFALLGGSPK